MEREEERKNTTKHKCIVPFMNQMYIIISGSEINILKFTEKR